jgi:hypothetical protein
VLGVVGESLRDNRIAVLADNGICLEGSLPGMRCAKDAQAQVAGAREYFECFECWQWLLQYSDSSARVLASNTRLQKHDAQGTRGGGGGRLARSCCLLKSGGAGTHGGK